MTRDEKSLLIAMSLGDGHVRPRGSLSVQHSNKQRDYLSYKANLISKIFDCKININEVNNNGFMQVRFEKSNRYFKLIRRWLYPLGVKIISRKMLNRLTPHAIAIWYMDDGSLSAKKKWENSCV